MRLDYHMLLIYLVIFSDIKNFEVIITIISTNPNYKWSIRTTGQTLKRHILKKKKLSNVIRTTGLGCRAAWATNKLNG